MKIFLNPGHDRKYDPGAVNPSTGLREADVAYDVCAAAKKYLEAAGCEARIMQSDNLWGATDYPERKGESVCEEANGWGADIFVSVHCNSFAEPAAHGTEIFVHHFGGAGEKLADCIRRQIIRTFDIYDRGIKTPPNTGFAVLNHTEMPAVLVEMAFISNLAEERLLRERQDDFARAIARGITDYQQGR